jgi:hypothetical protein
MDANEFKLVILESPFAGPTPAHIQTNLEYARKAGKECAFRHESILASHLLFPQFLDDHEPAERELGIGLGLAWRKHAHYSVFYIDLGWSGGMKFALNSAVNENLPFFVRAFDNKLRLPNSTEDVVEAVVKAFQIIER